MTKPTQNHEDVARRCLRPVRGVLTDDQYIEVLKAIEAALQDAFDLGFRAAGGVIAR